MGIPFVFGSWRHPAPGNARVARSRYQVTK
jgi:hypothetical protein